jgi:multidrug resistance efflux pump
MASACLGCRKSEHAELETVKGELAEARAELKLLQSEQRHGYLDELERLAALRAKGVLTEEEFESKKKAALAERPKQGHPRSSMDELARQLRLTQTLFNNSTITNLERDNRKGRLIEGPLSLTDLKKDLETVQKLFNEGVITNYERDTLKTRLLKMESAKK